MKSISKVSKGYSIGKGHQGNTPNLPIIRPVDDPRVALWAAMGDLQPGTKRYKMGKVMIFISPPVIEANMGWHMSISHPERYPTWDEVAAAWYQLVPDADNRVGVMVLPKRKDYINLHNFCFQVHEQLVP